jgi:hypothetical protein
MPFEKHLVDSGNSTEREALPWYASSCRQAGRRKRKERERMAKDRFVEVYSQGVANVEKIIVDTETGVNYVLASSSLTAGCGMSVLLDADGKPVVTPIN